MPSYSFFVAGHTYGNPDVNNKGLHPPFVDKFDLIEAQPAIAFGVLTGDITYRGLERDWIEVDSQLLELQVPVHYVVGNHDLGGPLFESRYGSTYYHFFWKNNEHTDLFLILNANMDEWNITGDQLTYFYETIDSAQDMGIKNVFIFCHQLIWWGEEADNPYRNVVVNATLGRADTTNFFTALEPRLRRYPGEVFFFAGDLGANGLAAPFMYHHYDNMTLIASGMGHEVKDNFVFVNVYPDGKVAFELIALQGEVNSLGKLEDYVLP